MTVNTRLPNRMGVKRALLHAGAFFILPLTLIMTVVPTAIYEMIDFSVFKGAAENLLLGRDIYSWYGSANLPYWLFPWLAWFMLPFTLFSNAVAQVLFTLASLAVGFLVMVRLFNLSGRVSIYLVMFLYSFVVWMGWLVFHVGQVTYFLLGAVGLAIAWAQKDRKALLGLLVPVFLLKPHLFMLFLPALLWVGGQKFLLSAVLTTLLFMGIAFLVQPDWPLRMLAQFQAMGGRVDTDPPYGFTSLPALLGMEQNYLGTAQLPVTLLLFLLAGVALWVFRKLPPASFLSLAILLSLLCAPRSYSYDMPLLLPGLVWLSRKWTWRSVILWASVLVVPFAFHFSTGAYLVVLLAAALGVHQAWSDLKSSRAQAGPETPVPA